MKILYTSCFHPVLEYDHCVLFEEMGHDWFSTGIYLDPKNPLNIPSLRIRKSIDREPCPALKSYFLGSNPKYYQGFQGLNRPMVVLNHSLVEWADVVFCTSYNYLINNWEVIKHKPIIWRTSGAINEEMEQKMKPYIARGNIKTVRFSPIELESHYSNGGVVIRNFADEGLYNDWNGEINKVLSFQSWFTQRRFLEINKNYLKHVYNKFDCNLYGAFVGSKDPVSKGTLTWDKQIQAYKNHKLYFYIGSPVGVVAYNFIEAMMTGCPIVTYGKQLGGWKLPSNGNLFHEPSDFIDNEVDGFYSDCINKMQDYINELLSNAMLAREVSIKSRKKALNLFSKQAALKKWREFFSENF